MLQIIQPPSRLRILGMSAAAINTPADTNEDILATVTIPAGAMGLNGLLQVYSLWSYTNSANNKTMRTRLGGIGGTIYMSTVQTTSPTYEDRRIIQNRAAANSQVGRSAGSATGGASSGAVVTSSVDTTAAVDIVFTGQKASSGETLTLEAYAVWLLVP